MKKIFNYLFKVFKYGQKSKSKHIEIRIRNFIYIENIKSQLCNGIVMLAIDDNRKLYLIDVNDFRIDYEFLPIKSGILKMCLNDSYLLDLKEYEDNKEVIEKTKTLNDYMDMMSL